MRAVVPDDQTFESKFAQATVSNSNLAKYYLRVLDARARANDEEVIVNPGIKVSLEHVLPRTSSPDWAHIPADQYPALVKRLGNLTLLGRRLNSKAANAGFAEKKQHFAKSDIQMSKELCQYTQWTAAEVDARQRALAKLAVKAWSSRPH
jgi:hypothetical protein